MKKILIILFIFYTNLISDTVFGMDKAEFQKVLASSMIEGLTLGTVKIKVDNKKKCNQKWAKNFNNKAKIITKYVRENQKLKRVLINKNISYYHIIQQRTNNISIDMDAVIKLSCTESQFDTLKGRMKYIERLKIENSVYKELMSLNNLNLHKSEYIKKNDTKEHIEAKADLKEQLRNSILDIK